MFDLKTASIGIRKACARRGIRTASLQFTYDGSYDPILDLMGDTRALAKIHPARGKVFSLTIGEINDAEDCTWKEITE